MCILRKENIRVATLRSSTSLSLLLLFTKTVATKGENLAVSGSVPPFTTITKKFIFLNALGIGSDPTNDVAPYTWRSS